MYLVERLLRTSAVLESMVVDEAGAIQEVNPAFATHAGLSADDLRGRPVADFVAVHEAERVRSWCRADAVLPEEGAPVSFVTSAGDPYTLWCLFERQASGIRIVGEARLQRDGPVAHEMMHLNNELATLVRESTRRRRELERTKQELSNTLDDLRKSYWHLQKIQEVMPLCMQCGRVKTGASDWQTVVEYLKSNEIFLSHGYCPACAGAVAEQFGLDPEE